MGGTSCKKFPPTPFKNSHIGFTVTLGGWAKSL